MLDTIKRYLKVFFSVRLLPVLVVYILLFALLVNRMFQLQIMKGDEYELSLIHIFMQYLTETQKISLDHIRTIKPYAANQFMLLDRATRRCV